MTSHAQLQPDAPADAIPVTSTGALGPTPRLRLAALLTLIFALFGLAAHLHTIASGMALIGGGVPNNVFFRLYALHERPFLLLLLAFAALVWWSRQRAIELPAPLLDRIERIGARAPAWGLALAILGITGAGTLLVMRGIPLAMDEYAASFQAHIFAAGRITASIPEQWRALAPWMTPMFIAYKPDAHLWLASYLPVYAGMRALFVPLHAEWLVNPLLAAASVVLLDRVARRLWPGDDRRRCLALAFLVTSAQFCVMSMSGYSMAAHLCLNLLWLLFYLRDDRAGYLAAPWVGVLAMGLHNPMPHVLFVAPFLARLLIRRRVRWLSYMSAVYLAGAAIWLQWALFTGRGPGGGSFRSLLAHFRMPDDILRFIQGLNLVLILTWQTPVVAVLLVLALLAWRDLEGTERDLATGLLLSFAFYLGFSATQGHGWGYRYIYGALGNIMLLAATGATLASRELRGRTLRTLIAVSLLLSVAVQLPLRLRQTETFVRPWSRMMSFIESRPAAVVAIDFDAGWYASDLVRNDPLFSRGGPSVVFYRPGWGPPLDAIPAALRDSVYVVSRRDMARLGIPLLPPRSPVPVQ
jgi:hypothetical protein